MESNPEEDGDGVTVYTDGSCTDQGKTTASAGSGIWFGQGNGQNQSMRVPGPEQTNQIAELFTVLQATKMMRPDVKLKIMSDSRYTINGLTKNLGKNEDLGWIGVKHAELFQCTAAWMRRRTKPTVLEWVKGHSGVAGNEGVDELAGEGGKRPKLYNDLDMSLPAGRQMSGAKLCKMSQKELYQGIRGKANKEERTITSRNLARIADATKHRFGYEPEEKAIWKSMRKKDVTRSTRDFLWKTTHNAFKVGDFWRHIPGFEDRVTCRERGEIDTIEHVLIECSIEGRELIWNLTDELWKKRFNCDILPSYGGILGCGLSNFNEEGRPNVGKNRLYRIIITESAHLIWKTRCERQIEGKKRTPMGIHNRWVGTMNNRLSLNCTMTSRTRYGKKAPARRLVKDTWKGCLMDEDSLPDDLQKKMGV